MTLTRTTTRALALALIAFATLITCLTATEAQAAKARTPKQLAAKSCKRVKGSDKRKQCSKRKVAKLCRQARYKRHRDCGLARKPVVNVPSAEAEEVDPGLPDEIVDEVVDPAEEWIDPGDEPAEEPISG